EIHHRVKNNLQIVISLFNAQSEFLDNPSALEAIKEGKERMQAIALIHQKLYQPDQGSLVKMACYIPEMVNNLKSGFADMRNIIFQLDVDEISLDVSQAVPVGLILNEAITNAVKYAFPQNRKGIIQVLFKKMEHEKVMLKIMDNGIGISNEMKAGEYKSLGTQLIKIFAEQLEAELRIENKNGVETILYFQPQVYNNPGT
ncbi:MAG: sensor histidine kinase, partial [Ferruginibacter sp.]